MLLLIRKLIWKFNRGNLDCIVRYLVDKVEEFPEEEDMTTDWVNVDNSNIY